MEPTVAAPQMIVAAALAAACVYLAFPFDAMPTNTIGSLLTHCRRLLERASRRGASRARQRSVEETNQVIGFTTALAAELRGGSEAYEAWERLWQGSTFRTRGTFGPLGHSLDDQPDVPALLRAAASTAPGRLGLERLAACWQVAERSGSGLADGLSRIALSLQHESEVATEIEGQLAGPRATVRLLTVLPILALILGQSLGAHPVSVLTTTPYGWLCLTFGTALVALGTRWVNRQVQSVWPVPNR
ncbi:MAG: hypothetical protein ABI586_11250 [Candidatus Nanopelagicales bacterium]